MVAQQIFFRVESVREEKNPLERKWESPNEAGMCWCDKKAKGSSLPFSRWEGARSKASDFLVLLPRGMNN